MFDNAMNIDSLDKVSGGKYTDYITVTDAIYNRVKELGLVKGEYTRLPEKAAVAWLEENLNITAEFNTTWGFDFLNGSAVYKDSRSSKAGIRYTQEEILKKIANWTPKK